ncbi:MAG TPA: hypothetical protein VFX03_04170, partial [Thermomicrobiales bacterium]|nr:hypothetical protein [Thermomicrobiales bacterium]
VSGSEERSIFRYDNADSKPGHEDAHHKHLFDPATWREKLPEEWIGFDRWPHLNEVIEELRDWWETTGQLLGIEVSDANEPT